MALNWIIDIDKVESVRRGCDTGEPAVRGGENGGEISCGKAPSTDIDKRADDIAHHMPEKAVGLELE